MSPVTDSLPLQSEWHLCERTEPIGSPRCVSVNANPFRIGRLPDLSLSLPNGSVSKLHAEIVRQGRSLWVRDLRSTNGTYVNGQLIRDLTPLHDQDLLQVGDVAFRVEQRQREAASNAAPSRSAAAPRAICLTPPKGKTPAAGGAGSRAENLRVAECNRTLPTGAAEWARLFSQFETLMSERAVTPHFQPIVNLKDGRLVGYEVLARSRFEGLDQPRLMFAMAEKMEQQCALSDMLRSEGVRVGATLPGQPRLFLNTHPAEIITDQLMESMGRLRREFPTQPLTIEVHQAAVTDLGQVSEFRALLRALDIGLAFDDFGTDQARLVELAAAAPEFVTFDIPMIRGIDRASPERQQALAEMVRLARGAGIATLAEGIEQPAELEACRQIGFDSALGLHFGSPAPQSAYV